MFKPLKDFIKILKQYKEFEKTEFFNDESDIVWEGNMGISHKSWLNFRNTHYAPGFTAKMIQTYCLVVEDELGVNLQIVDSDNCHLTWEKSFFSGNRSQFTPLGQAPCADLIRKPIFNIFPLLAKLGAERYILKPADKEDGIKYGVLATKAADKGYAFMRWKFEDGLDEDMNDRTIRLHIKNLDKKTTYDVVHFRIDGTHSNAYGKWREMGRPYPLTLEQIKTLRACDGLALMESPKSITGNTEFDTEYTIPMHGVSLVLLLKRLSADEPEKTALKKPELYEEKGVLGNQQVFLRWEFSSRLDLAGYRVYRQKNHDLSPVCINDSTCTQCSYFIDMEVEKGSSYTYSVSAFYADGTESGHSPENTITILGEPHTVNS
jgi:hypothetical protein